MTPRPRTRRWIRIRPRDAPPPGNASRVRVAGSVVTRLLGALPYAIVGLIVVVALIAVAGAFLPRTHTVASRVFYHQPVDSVWAAVVDVEHSPAWRTDIRSVERLPDRHGNPLWKLVSDEGSWSLEVIEAIPDQRYKTTVSDDLQGLGGSWTCFFASENGGTRLSLHEDGSISNPFFRVLGTWVFGLNAPLDAYLKALGRKFGEAVKPTHLPPSSG